MDNDKQRELARERLVSKLLASMSHAWDKEAVSTRLRVSKVEGLLVVLMSFMLLFEGWIRRLQYLAAAVVATSGAAAQEIVAVVLGVDDQPLKIDPPWTLLAFPILSGHVLMHNQKQTKENNK